MAWTQLAAASLNRGDLALYRGDDGAYMIRFDGLELMNSRWHRSEDELGRLAAAIAPRPNARVLLGGLGLGYTLAALAGALGDAARITVAEISPDVIAWYERWLAPTLFDAPPGNVRLVATDVADLIRSEGEYGEYDVILLDVDNGPGTLPALGNQDLYGAEFLRAARARLADSGSLLVWSSREAPDFVARSREAGFASACRPVAFPDRPDLKHYIYQLAKAGPAAP